MRFVYTDGSSPDFSELCYELDNFLNELVGGEENRAEYIPYNQLDDIHNVIVAYDDDLVNHLLRQWHCIEKLDIKLFQTMGNIKICPIPFV